MKLIKEKLLPTGFEFFSGVGKRSCDCREGTPAFRLLQLALGAIVGGLLIAMAGVAAAMEFQVEFPLPDGCGGCFLG